MSLILRFVLGLLFINILTSCAQSASQERDRKTLQYLQNKNPIFDGLIFQRSFKELLDKYDQIRLFLKYDNLTKVYVITRTPDPTLHSIKFSKEQALTDLAAPLPKEQMTGFIIFGKHLNKFDAYIYYNHFGGIDSGIDAHNFDLYVEAKANLENWKDFFPDGFKKQLDSNYNFLTRDSDN